MNRTFRYSLFLILVLGLSQLILFACAGPQEIFESEKKYIQGVVEQGGIRSVRIKDDSGNILRFAAGNDVEYEPSDFHAYYGDRVAVTYYTVLKGDKESHTALKLVLLAADLNRIDLRSGAAEGIIRASGMMRYLVHLPKHELTVAFYKKGGIAKSPSGWLPKTGNKVKVFFTEEPGRFVTKFRCYQIDRLAEDPVSIQEKSEYGLMAEVFVHRSVKKAPDRFAFRLQNGKTVTMFAGGETQVIPTDLKVESGQSYKITYYRLLLGDQSIRYVASRIEM